MAVVIAEPETRVETGAGGEAERPPALPAPRHDWFLLLILLVALARGLIGIAIMPPWQHYEEPTHFEYAALIRILQRVPAVDHIDVPLRQAIAESMLAWQFWPPPAPAIETLISEGVGVNVRGHPPTYHMLVAGALWLLPSAPVEVQLYAGRLVSLALFLVLLALAGLVLRRLLPEDPFTARATLLALVALSPFTTIMGAVNNDVLSNTVGVLLLLVAITTVRAGLSWRMVLAGAAVILLALATKRTLLVYSLLIPLSWLLASGIPLRRLLLAAAAALAATLILLAAQPTQPAYWFADTGSIPARSAADAPLGAYAVRLASTAAAPAVQRLPLDVVRSLHGQPVTLGAWVRATAPLAAGAGPVLQLDDQLFSAGVPVDAAWRFVALTVTVPRDASFVQVVLPPSPAAAIELDGLVLAPGALPLDQPPVFDQAAGQSGMWGGTPFVNLLRNGSAELGIPTGPLLHQLGRILPERDEQRTLSMVYDVPATLPMLASTLVNLSESFWGHLGWGQVRAPQFLRWYTLALTLAGVLGWSLWLYRLQAGRTGLPAWQHAAFLLVTAAVLLAWGTATLRVLSQPTPYVQFFWPVGRYTFMAALPSMLVVVIGLQQLAPRHLRRTVTLGALAGLWVYDLVLMLFVVVPFYYVT